MVLLTGMDRSGAMLGTSNGGFSPCRNIIVAVMCLARASIWIFPTLIEATIDSPSAFAQSSRPETSVKFNIPAQPLARALATYAAVTGLEVFYNAALADRQVSAEVVGPLTPAVALQTLLLGTGYVARTTGPGAFTIMPEPREATVAAVGAGSVGRLYEPYFATIQARVSALLCRNAEIGLEPADVFIRIWLAPSGLIARAEVVDDGDHPARDQTLANAMRGVAIGAPPAGMSQPVNMVIFPPSKASERCRPVEGRGGAR